MSEKIEVVLLASPGGVDESARPLPGLLDRLERRGVSARVVGRWAPGEFGGDARFMHEVEPTGPWLPFGSLRRLRQRLGPGQPRLVHAIGEPAAGLALALAEAWALPYLVSIHNFDTLDRGIRVSRRLCRGLVVPVPELAESLTAELAVPGDRLAVIPPGILPVDVPPRPPGNVPVVGAALGTGPDPGLAAFLGAARLVTDAGKDVEFLVAPRSEGTSELRALARSLKIVDRVSVAGFPATGMGFWGLLDVYCDPALGPSSGRALAVAMAHGVPSIAARVRGLRSMIRHGETGVLVEPGEPGQLAAAIIGLLDDREEARGMGFRGRSECLGRFDPDAEADLLASLYLRTAGASA